MGNTILSEDVFPKIFIKIPCVNQIVLMFHPVHEELSVNHLTLHQGGAAVEKSIS